MDKVSLSLSEPLLDHSILQTKIYNAIYCNFILQNIAIYFIILFCLHKYRENTGWNTASLESGDRKNFCVVGCQSPVYPHWWLELQPGGDHAGDNTLTTWDHEGLAALVAEVHRVQGQKHVAGRHVEDLENTQQKCWQGARIQINNRNANKEL